MPKLPSWLKVLLGIALAFMLHFALPSNSDALTEFNQLLLTDVRSPEIVHPMPVAYGSEPILKRRPDLARIIKARALLLATYDTEGTYPNENPYTLTYGYERFEGFDSHPQKQVCRTGNGRRLCSDAAGACQFVYNTWIGVYNKYKPYFLTHHPETGEPIGAFHPLNQDRACLLNFIDKGGYPNLLRDENGGITEEGRIWLDEKAVDLTFQRLCCQWASFQCEPGKGYGTSNGCYDGNPDYPEAGNQKATPTEVTRKMYLQYLEQQEIKLGIIPAATASTSPEVKPEPPPAPIDPNSGNPEWLFSKDMQAPAQKGETIGGYPITSPRGPRIDPISGASGAFHKGADSAAPEGTLLYAIGAGKAVCIPDPNPGQKVGGGNQIKFYLNSMPDVYFVMKHLVSCEDVVWDGTGDAPVVGKVGTTGYSTGPHLHLEKWLNGEHIDFPKGWFVVVYTSKMPEVKAANNVVKFDRPSGGQPV